ncbi:hypothetical protein TL16_g10956 [Triparma laevis f. inornata]|uniref:RING-type domain-containing protein n=1 Tax=Triparma laevis f. inornata TaxID=1714386 RepID=A0A9W7BH19_9STRA|nr:hypothetical protein TL16_g10956 [Triparma laevis f. inornata]
MNASATRGKGFEASLIVISVSLERIRTSSTSAPVPSVLPAPLKGSVDEEEEYEDKCVICLDNVSDAQMRPYGHSAVCRYCTQELMPRSEPCPICPKPITSFEIEGGKGIYYTVREKMEQQVLLITRRSEDLVKLRALAKLCSMEFFNDESLLVVAWRRIFEVLELAMLEEKKVRGKKKKQQKKKDPRKLELWTLVRLKGRRLKNQREFQQARDAYERSLSVQTKVLGEDLPDTLMTILNLGVLYDSENTPCSEEYGGKLIVVDDKRGNKSKDFSDNEKALEYYGRSFEGYERTLGKNHPATLSIVMNMVILYKKRFGDYGKAEELYVRALEGRGHEELCV